MKNKFILECPVEGDKVTTLEENINNWLRNPSLNLLVKEFGEEIPDYPNVNDLSKWLLSFSDKWDFRKQQQAFDKNIGEGARWLATSTNITDQQKKLIAKASIQLGLSGNSVPRFDYYDYVLVLGGAKLSCLLRCRLTKQIVSGWKLPPKAIVLLGSMQPISDSEREATNTYAPAAKTEFDLFVSAGKLELGVENCCNSDKYIDNSNPNSSWEVREITSINKNENIFILAAPSSEPDKRRANSIDTYKFFLEKFNISTDAKILLVTSQIYVPYQHMEAIRSFALPHNIILDTIGFPIEWGGSLQGMAEPSNYLQEIRSTIQSINRFLDSHKSL